MPPIPDEDHDFTPELARKIIALYQQRIAALEAQLAERDADLAEFARRLGPRWFLEQNWFPATLSALEATPPAPKVTEEEWREIERAFQPRIRDGYTDVKVSKPGFWFVKGPGPAAAQEAGKP